MYRIAWKVKWNIPIIMYAQVVPDLLQPTKFCLILNAGTRIICSSRNRLLVLCGSVNEITVKQLVYARKHGFGAGRLQNGQKLDPAYRESEAGKEFLNQIYKEIV